MSADATLRRLGAVATTDLGPDIEEALDTMTTSHKRLKAINKDWNRFCAKQQVEDNVVFDAQKTRSVLTKAAELESSMDHLEICIKQAQSETKHKLEMVTKNNVDLQHVKITPPEAQLAIMLFDTGLANGIIQKIIDKDTEQRIKQNLDGQASGHADTQQDVFKRTIEANEEIVNLKSELKRADRENQRLKSKVQETQKQLDDAEEKATIEARKLEQRIEVLQSEQSDSSLRDIISRLEQEKLLLDKELKLSEAQVITSKQAIQTVLDSKKQALDRCERIVEENKSRVQEMEDWCRRTFQQDIDLLKNQKADLKSQLDGANAEVSKLKEKTTELSASNDRVSQLEKAHAEKVQGLNSQLSLSERRVHNLEKDLETKTTELSDSEKRVSNLQQQLEDVQTANVNTVQRLKDDLSASEGRVCDLEKSLGKAQASLQADLQVIAEKAKNLSALEAQLATSEGRVRDLEKDLEKAQLEVSERVRDLEKAQANLQVAEAKIKELSASKERISELGKQLQEAETASQELHDKVKAREEQIKTQSENAQKLQNELNEANADARDYRMQSFELQGQVEDLIVVNRALQSENDEQGRSMIDMDEAAAMMENDKSHLHAQLSRLRAQVNALNHACSEYGETVRRLTKERNESRDEARNFKAEADQAQQEARDLVSQVSGLTGALTKVNQGDRLVTTEDLDPSVRRLQDQAQKLTTSYHELHANVEHCVAFLNDYTGYRLPMDSWIRVLHLAVSPVEGDVDSYDGIREFWRVQDTWGNGRSTYSQDSAGILHSCLSLYAVLVSRPDGMDWMNLALLHASNLLSDMIDEPQKIYRGLLVEITNMVVRMVNEHILYQNDPLLLSVWQILTYANAMTQRSLAVAMVSLVEVFGGQLTKLVTAITSGPSAVQALCDQEESGIYYDVSEVGVLLDRDMGTNEQWYILLNFADQNLRVVVGKRWKFVYAERTSIQFSGNQENTTHTFEIEGGGPWWFASL